MEKLWVALLAVGTTLFPSGIGGSDLHGFESGPEHFHLIPHEWFYTNLHSPIGLSHLHGLRIDEALAISRNGDGQLHIPVDETLAVARNEEEPSSPAPVVEPSVEINKNELITPEQLFQQIFGRQSGLSEGNNTIENGVPSTGVETVISSSDAQSNVEVSPSVADLQVPQSRSEASSSQISDLLGPQSSSEASAVQSSVSPVPIAPEQEGPLHPGAILTNGVGEVYINAEKGKLQMQASALSGQEGLKVSVGDIPKLSSDSVSVIIPELSASSITKASKPHIITNVNVNVNVNADETGSGINSTSVAEITAPIKTDHKKCD